MAPFPLLIYATLVLDKLQQSLGIQDISEAAPIALIMAGSIANSAIIYSDQLARIIWASQILHLLTSERAQVSLLLPEAEREAVDLGDEDDEDDETPFDSDVATIIADLESGQGVKVRQSFLDCIAELLACANGWAYVTATALREREDNVEVDVARNIGFEVRDEEYQSLLQRHLLSFTQDQCERRCHFIPAS